MSQTEQIEDFKARIEQVMDRQGISTISELSKLTGVPEKTLRGAMRRGSIGSSSAQLISKKLNLSFRWIKDGKSPELPPLGKALEDVYVLVKKAKSRFSAGAGIEAEEGFHVEQYAFRRHWLTSVGANPDRVILVDVDGDSMHPTFHSGDTVLVDLNRIDLYDGRVYAVGIGNLVHLRRLQWKGTELIEIIPDNPIYSKFEVPPDDIRIFGRIIWFARVVP